MFCIALPVESISPAAKKFSQEFISFRTYSEFRDVRKSGSISFHLNPGSIRPQL